jgi:cytoskeleton protein RodZ
VSEQDDQTVEAAGETVRTATIGLLLRKAREARGLTVADVVTALKYSPRQIEALETDQMPLQSGNVFMRGIVRSYARFLKLDPEPLLALLEAEVPTAVPDVAPPEDMGVAMPRSGRPQISGLVAAAILISILAAAIGVWHFVAPVPSSAPTVAAIEPPGAVASTPPEPGVTQAETAGRGSSSAPAVQATIPVAAPELTPASASHAVEGETASPSAAQPLPANARQVTFEFRGVSWVEVKDASQQIVFTGEYVAGSRQVATGLPPFQIIIGNAPLVDVSYGGRSVDLKPYTRADVARLTLN